MYFLMVCPHNTGAEINALRDQLRPEHRAWVTSGGNGLARVLTGSALWNADGDGIGNFGILESRNEDAARAFAMGDPFFKGGVVKQVALTRLADSFQAHRIDPITPAAPSDT